MNIEYVRCDDCGYIYPKDLSECPICGSTKVISENEIINESVFNIMD